MGLEIRAYVGALPVAATLLALVVSTGSEATLASAQAPALPAPVRSAGTLTPAVAPAATAEPAPSGLYPGAGYELGGSRPVRDLQRLLARAGYAPGPIDGRYGPLTEQAVRRFQADRGLQVDAIAGRQTLAALMTPGAVLLPGAGYELGGSRPVRDLQRLLARAGYAPGPIDGRYGPLTEQAVQRFQADRGLQIDGIAGRRTLARLRMRRHSYYAARGQPGRAPAPTKAPQASQPKVPGAGHPSGLLPIGWLVLLGALGLGLLVTRVWDARRSRGDQLIPSPKTRGGRAESATLEHDATLGAPLDGLKAMAGANGPHRRVGERGEADGAFNLGASLEDQNDLAGAEAAYRRADERGHAAAASNLGVLLERQGDHAGAEAAYRRADERGEANGAFNLGVLLETQGDLAGAEAAYRRADERSHAAAASNLGVLLEGQADPAGAEAAYRRADERGEAKGAFNLGALLEEQGDLAGAEPAYRRAGESGHAKVAQMARAALLDLPAGIHYPSAGRNGGGNGRA